MSLTLLLKVVVCLSVKCSLGVDLYGGEDHTGLKHEPGVSKPNNEIVLASTPNQNGDVCEEAVTLQNVLKVMITMLRQDLSKSSKTAYLLETLKDLLRNTGELNDEVKEKMNDLMRTLDKHKGTEYSNDKALRSNNLNPMNYLVRQSLTPFQKINLGYEIPVLTNKYCTEALLSIIKIAYQAYQSLAKNPICNLPELPQPLLHVKPENLLVSDFSKPISPSQDLQPEIWDSLLPKTKLSSFVLPDDSKPPAQYKPVFENLPDQYDPIDGFKSPDTSLPYPPGSSLYPIDQGKYPSNPYLPNSVNPVYPYSSVKNTYPETNPQEFTPYWYGVKPTSLPLNYHSQIANQPLYFKKVAPSQSQPEIMDSPISLPVQYKPVFEYLPEKYDSIDSFKPDTPYPIYSTDDGTYQSSPYLPQNPVALSYEYTPNSINPVYPYKPVGETDPKRNPKEFAPYALGTKPRSIPLNYYSPQNPLDILNTPNFRDANPSFVNEQNDNPEVVFEYPYSNQNFKHSNAFPFEPNHYNFLPNKAVKPKYDYPLPYEPESKTPYIPFKPYPSNSPTEPDVFEFPVGPSTQKPYTWFPDSFPVSINDVNNHNTPYRPTGRPQRGVDSDLGEWHPDTYLSQLPKAGVLKFIKDAIAVIEGEIPVVQFDEPTLYIIAKIKNILVFKDVEADAYATLLDLYLKLINYIKQLNTYKQIIDRLDLSRVTNGSKLKANNVVELTYLVKRPQPVVYYPYYYVKYRLPYHSFLLAANKLLKEKPDLRTNPHQLHEKLLSLSKVVETSPDLESYDKKDIMHLTYGSGSLVDAKLIGENGTLTDQLHVLRNITSELAAENIFDNNKETTNEIKHHTNDQNYLPNDAVIDDRIESNNREPEPTYLPSPDLQLRESTPTTEANLSTFDSSKLRRDILQGEYGGLPFFNYSIPINMNPLNSLKEPNSKVQIAPAIYKLAQATLDADKLNEANQQNIINYGGLVNHDNQRISMNTGNGNHQQFVKISNPKIMINTAKTVQSVVNSGNTQPGSGVSSQQMGNAALELQNPQNSVSQQKMVLQQNYYNQGGLVNSDNQKISMNTGSQNVQDHVDIENSKMIYNYMTNSQNHTDRNSIQANTDQLGVMNNLISDENKEHTSINTGSSQITQQDLVNTQTSSKGNSRADSVNFVTPEIGAASNVVEQTPSWPDYGNPEKQEMENYIKNTVKKDFREFYNNEVANLHGEEEKNIQNSNDLSSYNNVKPMDVFRPLNSQDYSNIDDNKFIANPGSTNGQLLDINRNKRVVTSNNQNLNDFSWYYHSNMRPSDGAELNSQDFANNIVSEGYNNGQLLDIYKNKMGITQGTNQDQLQNIIFNPSTATDAVRFNEQKLVLNPGYYGMNAFGSNAESIANQQINGISQQNIAISQNNLANGAYPRLYGQQISKFFRLPVYTNQPVVQSFPVMSSSAMPMAIGRQFFTPILG